MSIASIEKLIVSLPELEGWPEIASVFRRAGDLPRPDWQLPMLACKAVGGDESVAIWGAAAIACLQISIILVDDMLDEDPRGEHLKRGHGPAANLAMAYQATAFRLASQDSLSSPQQAALLSCLAHIALATACGQQLDVKNLVGEKNYWRVVLAKSTPFYGGALKAGGIIGGASPELAAQLYDLGVLIGEIIQIEDDLEDALQTPANADWIQGRNNLLILYAREADHPDRAQFVRLLTRIEDPDVLAQAQQILLRSGAVSFSAYHLVDRYQNARSLLGNMSLPNPSPILNVLEDYAATLVNLLRVSGVEISKEMLLEFGA